MRWLATLVAIGAIGGCAPPEPPGAEPKNLVILSIDTLRPDHLGTYGYGHPTSPNLDRFAERSVVFEQAVTVHVSTAPAHATVLTGLYPASHGIRRNGMRLAADVPTLAEILTDRGWATGAFVSGWTLERHTGLVRGFEVYDDRLDGPGAGARRAGDLTTEAALDWLGRQVEERRFFLFLHLFEPHWPYDPPAAEALRFLPGRLELTTSSRPVHLDRLLSANRLSALEQREYVARYDGEIAVADRLLGRLLAALDHFDIADETVVVVLSDHGETLLEREWTMDHGARPVDEQAKVPLILHLPGDPSSGLRLADQVSLLDVAPTLLALFGITGPPGTEGASLLPLIRGEGDTAGPRPVFITARSEPDRVPHITSPLRRGAVVRAIRLPGLKLVEYPKAPSGWHPELFDLEADRGELTDLASLRPDVVAALRTELDRWQSVTGGGADLEDLELEPEVEAALRELGYLGD